MIIIIIIISHIPFISHIDVVCYYVDLFSLDQVDTRPIGLILSIQDSKNSGLLRMLFFSFLHFIE